MSFLDNESILFFVLYYYYCFWYYFLPLTYIELFYLQREVKKAVEYLFLWVWYKWFIWFCTNLSYPSLIHTGLFFMWILHPALSSYSFGRLLFFFSHPLILQILQLYFWMLFLGEGCAASPTFTLQVIFSALLDIQHLKKGTVHRKVESFTTSCIPLHYFFSIFAHDQLILRGALKSRDLKNSVHLCIQYKAGTQFRFWSNPN